MAQNRLISESIKNYKNAPFSSWFLGVTVGILITALTALNLVAPGVIFVVFPLLIIPIIFSGMLQHIIFKTRGQLTLSSSLKAFGLYFRRDFFGCFSIIISSIKGLVCFLAIEMTASFISSTILQATSKNFIDALTNFYTVIENESLVYSDILDALYAYDGILFIYFAAIVFPAVFIAFAYALYSMSRTSIVIYFKMHVKNINVRFAKMVYGDVVRRNRWRLLKDYMLLNWPLYLLYIIGSAGGVVGCFFWKGDLLYMFAGGLIGGALLSMFFLPFYFGNQEVLYEKYAEQFQISTNNVTSYLLQNLQNNIDLTIEEKERLEKSFNDFRNPLEDDDERNKKDPEEPN